MRSYHAHQHEHKRKTQGDLKMCSSDIVKGTC